MHRRIKRRLRVIANHSAYTLSTAGLPRKPDARANLKSFAGVMWSMDFSSFGLYANVLRGVQDLKYTEPTEIQKEAIPAGMAGRDVLACASTGSGKTAAFLLPILNRLQGKPRGVTRALIVTPTRELAQQIHDMLHALARNTANRGAAIYGGVGMGAQRDALQRGIDVVIATPGRLLDHLQYSYARLNRVECLVLDEADRMLDMGFLPDIRRILKVLPKQRQTFFFSATVPAEIAALAHDMLRDPVSINIKRQAQPAAGVTQCVYPVPQTHKSPLLLKLVREESVRNALVFTRTKRRADRVAEFLVRNGVKAERIHGDRSQSQRTQALDGFKRGRFRVLVATDVAARGLDVHALSHVINFDMPGSVEDYIHRVGRTARAQATGEAYTFVTPEEESELRGFERRLTRSIPRARVPELDHTPTAASQIPESRPWHGPQRRNSHARTAGDSQRRHRHKRRARRPDGTPFLQPQNAR